MSDRWGSHWRWRAVLLLATVCLVGYGWVLADQWRLRKVVAGSGNPAALYIEGRSGASIAAYDWKTGKSWHVADKRDSLGIRSLHAVGNGKAVAWLGEMPIEVVDLQPPHAHRQYSTPRMPDDRFIGMTDDEHFAVFQTEGERVPTANGGTEVSLRRTVGKNYPPVIVHRIVDLKSGEVVDTRDWESTLIANGASNEFLSRRQVAKPIDPEEPAAALWKITAAGKWEKVEGRDVRFSLGSLLALVGNKQDRWRLVEDNAMVGLAEEAASPRVIRISPAGEFVLAIEMAGSRMFVVNTRSEEVHRLAVSYPSLAVGEFVDDGKALLMADLRDDVRVIDSQTGKLLTKDGAGSQRRNRLAVVAALLLLISAILLGTAIRERPFAWTTVDVAVSFVAAQIGIGYALIGFTHPEMYSVWPGGRFWVMSVACYLLGMFIGSATMVGIYWTFGRGWLIWRWLVGALGLCVFAAPLIATWEQAQGGVDLSVVTGVTLAFGLLFAGAANCIGVLVRALGWTLRDSPVEENPRQYRLATFFLMVAAMGVLIVIGQWLFTGPRALETVAYVAVGLAIITSAMLLAGILLSDLKAWTMMSATVLLIFAVVGGIYVHGEYAMGGISRYEIYLLEGPSALATAVTVAIPCLVLRLRGWRWRRGVVATGARRARRLHH